MKPPSDSMNSLQAAEEAAEAEAPICAVSSRRNDDARRASERVRPFHSVRTGVSLSGSGQTTLHTGH